MLPCNECGGAQAHKSDCSAARAHTMTVAVMGEYYYPEPGRWFTVHILHFGRTLCPSREVAGLPKDWPPRHRWVPVSESDKANCLGCLLHLPVDDES